MMNADDLDLLRRRIDARVQSSLDLMRASNRLVTDTAALLEQQYESIAQQREYLTGVARRSRTDSGLPFR